MPHPDADRNLLFGILALQMDFADRDGLVAAMNAWVPEKYRPLGDLLVDRGGGMATIRDKMGHSVAGLSSPSDRESAL
jgi:hypothetical protein